MTWWFDGKILKILFFLQSGNTLAPTMMPIVQQPRRPLGRESFRQRNIQGCVPQNMVFRQDQPNLNIDNCFVLKSQLRRYFIHYFFTYLCTNDWLAIKQTLITFKVYFYPIFHYTDKKYSRRILLVSKTFPGFSIQGAQSCLKLTI